MKSVRAILRLGLVGAIAGSLLSCRRETPKDTLLIAGSSTMAMYIGPLVQVFANKNPSVSVVCDPGGAAASIVALKHEAIDIAMLTRDVTNDEDDRHLRDYLIARDGMAIVVNPKNPIDGLSMSELAGIASGAVSSWRSVPCAGGRICGPESPIVFVDRPKGSHIRRSFMDLVLSGEEPAARGRVAQKADEVAAIVASDVHAIAYVPLKKLSTSLKALAIGGVEMNRTTMLSGRYPLTRSFYLAVYRHPRKLAESFIEFAVSREGQAILSEDGLLNVY